MNELYVKFTNDPIVYTFFAAVGNKLDNLKKDIEKETERTIERISFNKFN